LVASAVPERARRVRMRIEAGWRERRRTFM
jgi:hypothetical protein